MRKSTASQLTFVRSCEPHSYIHWSRFDGWGGRCANAISTRNAAAESPNALNWLRNSCEFGEILLSHLYVTINGMVVLMRGGVSYSLCLHLAFSATLGTVLWFVSRGSTVGFICEFGWFKACWDLLIRELLGLVFASPQTTPTVGVLANWRSFLPLWFWAGFVSDCVDRAGSPLKLKRLHSI